MSDTVGRHPKSFAFLMVVSTMVVAVGLGFVVCIVMLRGLFSQVAEKYQPNWKEYTSAKGGFTVMVPAAPNENEQGMGTMLLSTTEMYFVMHGNRAEFAKLVAQIYYHDNLQAAPKPKDLTELELVLLQTQPSKVPGAPRKAAKFLAEGKYPGLELESDDGLGVYRDRWILTPTRVFFLRYTLPANHGSDPPEGAEKFFQSFKIKPLPPLWML